MDAGEPLGHLGRDLLQDRGGEQEVARVIGLLVEHLLGQEVEQVAVLGGGDGMDELPPLLRRRSLAQGDLDELQGRGPALGASLELRDLGGLQWIVVDVAEQLADLRLGEAQRIGPELGVAAVRLEAGELEARLDERGEHEPAGRRRVAQDLVPEATHLGDRVHVLPVVDDEGARFGQSLVHFGQEIRRHARPGRARSAHLLEHRVCATTEARVALADRLDQVADVEGPVAIVAIELVPVAGERHLALPLPQEGRLAVAGIGGDDRGAARGGIVEPVDQPRAAQRRRRVVRRRDLIEDEGIGVLDVRQSTALREIGTDAVVSTRVRCRTVAPRRLSAAYWPFG